MRRLLFAVFFLLGPIGSAFGQARLTGRIVDADTETPLPGVHVFIASTMVGTTTDTLGLYDLTSVPLGSARLFVSMLGYHRAIRDIIISRPDTLHFDFTLKPEVISLGNITVEAKLDKHWRKRLKKFIRLFIGEGPFAKDTEIMNPEVLDFETKWYGKLTARASEPLDIENHALGYRIRYFLREFISTGTTLKYDGEPFFDEMTARNSEENETWQENRKRAYMGSFHHFMVASLADQLADQGFRIHRLPSLERIDRNEWLFPVEVKDILHSGPSPGLRTLRFYGVIEVRYERERETLAYVRRQGASFGRYPGDQRSWLELTHGPTDVDRNGTIIDPYGLTLYGYFAFEHMSDDLPNEYRPPSEQ